MDEILHSLALDIPIVALSLIFVSALIEYLFPPYPGDTLVLGGFLLAGSGNLPLVGTAAAAVGGSIAGALLAYWVGSRFGDSYFLIRKSARARDRVARLRIIFRRYGPRLLMVNRFLPGLRGVFLYLAGMNRMGLRPVLLYSTISNLAWLVLIGFIGLRVGKNLEHARALVRGYSWAILLLFVTLFVLQAVWRRVIEPRLLNKNSGSTA
jgi:membrane protein DedA with SNARE-associated domain